MIVDWRFPLSSLLLLWLPSECHGFASIHPVQPSTTRDHHGATSPSALNAATLADISSSSSWGGGHSHPSFLSSSYFATSYQDRPSSTAATTTIEKMPLDELADRLDEELYENQWFVTGKVNPAYFAPDFTYEDADVQLESLQDYIHDVQALFDQDVTRADIISTAVNPELGPNVITCTWRLSGRANLLNGFDIKPFVVYTDFVISPTTGLIQHQEDRYSIRNWDVLISALFPTLNGRLTAKPAPPVPTRIHTPSREKVMPVEAWTSRAGIGSYFSSSSTTQVHEEQVQQEEEEEEDLLPEFDQYDDEEEDISPAELYAYSDVEKVLPDEKRGARDFVPKFDSHLHPVPSSTGFWGLVKNRNMTTTEF